MLNSRLGPTPSILVQACLPRSVVPCDSPHEGQSMWDSASITLCCAKLSLLYFILHHGMECFQRSAVLRDSPSVCQTPLDLASMPIDWHSQASIVLFCLTVLHLPTWHVSSRFKVISETFCKRQARACKDRAASELDEVASIYNERAKIARRVAVAQISMASRN